VTRTSKDIFAQKWEVKHACIHLAFLLNPRVTWLKIEFLHLKCHIIFMLS